MTMSFLFMCLARRAEAGRPEPPASGMLLEQRDGVQLYARRMTEVRKDRPRLARGSDARVEQVQRPYLARLDRVIVQVLAVQGELAGPVAAIGKDFGGVSARKVLFLVPVELIEQGAEIGQGREQTP